MITICVPFLDFDLIGGAGKFRVAAGMGDGTSKKKSPEKAKIVTPIIGSLSSLTPKDTLYVMAHGRYASSSEILGLVGPFKVKKTMTASDLAAFLAKKGLQQNFIDLRLIVCWGGYVGGDFDYGKNVLKRTSGQAPFAGQLCGVMKEKYKNIRVTGYRGEAQYYSKNKKGTLDELPVQLPGSSSPISGGLLTNSMTYDSLKDVGGFATFDNDSRTVWY